jgi:RimJ/RimL family protein N-acetyltransferase
VKLSDGSIVLRRFTEEDVPGITAACQDAEIARWTRVPSPYLEDDARAFVLSAPDNVYAIADQESGELLGAIDARTQPDGIVDIGYWVRPEARGQGVASRALGLLSRWAFEELGAGRVQVRVEPGNVASLRVAEKAGFQREGTLRAVLELRGRRRDAVVLSLLPDDIVARD